VKRTYPTLADLPRRRTSRAVLRRLALTGVAVLTVSVTARAIGADSGSAGEAASPTDALDGRSYWRKPARKIVFEGGEKQEGVEWVDVVVDGALERVPRMRPATERASPLDGRTRYVAPLTVLPTPSALPAPEAGRPQPQPADRSPPVPAVAAESNAPSGAASETVKLIYWLEGRGAFGDDLGRPCSVADDALANRLDALGGAIVEVPLDGGVSRVWSALRLRCEEAVEPMPTPPEGSAPLFVIGDDVPPGFEMLAAPRSAWVDIRFNGRLVGSTFVTTTADRVLFDLPAEVVAMLPGIEDPEGLLQLLSRPFPPNADRVCFRPRDPIGCGVVEPSPVAVIYDENSLTLDLFIAGALQRLPPQTARYLPAPERRPASILSLFTSTARTPGSDADVDLSARLLTSYGSGHVSAAADYGSDAEEARLNELKLTHYANGHELTAGTYRWGVGGALNDVSLAGVGFSTSFRTRLGLEQALGTELIVDLPRRAIVQIVVDGRVQSGDSYEAGVRALDTRTLQDGTYPVEIRIIESDGATRSEFRTFTKSTSMPPRGEPVFSATAGVARPSGILFPEDPEPLVAGFDIAQRVGERTAVTLGAAQLGEDGFGQSEFVYLGEALSLQAAFTLGRRRTVGTVVNAATTVGNTRAGLSYRNFSSEVESRGDPVRELFYPARVEQWNATLSRPFGRVSVGLSAGRVVERADGAEPVARTRYSVRARRSLYRSRDLRSSVSAGFRDANGVRSGDVRLDVSFGRGGWSSGLALETEISRDGDLDVGQIAQLGYAGRTDVFDWRAGARARRGGSSDSAGASVRVRHPLFRAGASHDVLVASSGRQNSSSVATASTTIGFDRRGLAVGGDEGSRSGVIVDVTGTPDGALFDIVVNNARTAVGEVGASRFVGLQPFESYAVKLVPRGVLSNGIGSRVYEFTLFPGNVQRIVVRAESRVLLIAALVDAEGEPLGSAVVEDGDDLFVTAADGLLQAELPVGRSFTVKPLRGGDCVITVPAVDPGVEVHVVEDPLLCRDDPVPDAPDTLGIEPALRSGER